MFIYIILYLSILMHSIYCIMPLPFTRELLIQTPPLNGNDIIILQNLLKQNEYDIYVTGIYDYQSEFIIKKFQKEYNIKSNGIVDKTTASMVLDKLSNDNYKDNNVTANELGYFYKIYIPIFNNRSIETEGILYDKYNNILHRFITRTKGQENQFTTNGNTPTGLSVIDFNTPEQDISSFGPYNLNRIVQGLDGNAKFLIPSLRNGLLLHSGAWDLPKPSPIMPNSNGCIHIHDNDMKIIAQILKEKLDIKLHNNTYGKWPYPFQAQGIISIEVI